MNKIIKLVLFLGIISALSGLCISLVNEFTEPIITENALREEERSLAQIYPDAQFEKLDIESDGIIIDVYDAVGYGYVFKAKARGYNTSTPITLLIGLDYSGKTTKVIPLEQQETNGFGSRCFEEENMSALYLNRTTLDGVDMLSGATYTSSAMREMIEAAWRFYEGMEVH